MPSEAEASSFFPCKRKQQICTLLRAGVAHVQEQNSCCQEVRTAVCVRGYSGLRNTFQERAAASPRVCLSHHSPPDSIWEMLMLLHCLTTASPTLLSHDSLCFSTCYVATCSSAQRFGHDSISRIQPGRNAKKKKNQQHLFEFWLAASQNKCVWRRIMMLFFGPCDAPVSISMI